MESSSLGQVIVNEGRRGQLAMNELSRIREKPTARGKLNLNLEVSLMVPMLDGHNSQVEGKV